MLIDKDIKKILEDIALEELGFETLNQQMNDEKDFKVVSVWGVKSALESAYKLGLSNKKNQAKQK